MLAENFYRSINLQLISTKTQHDHQFMRSKKKAACLSRSEATLSVKEGFRACRNLGFGPPMLILKVPTAWLWAKAKRVRKTEPPNMVQLSGGLRKKGRVPYWGPCKGIPCGGPAHSHWPFLHRFWVKRAHPGSIVFFVPSSCNPCHACSQRRALTSRQKMVILV